MVLGVFTLAFAVFAGVISFQKIKIIKNLDLDLELSQLLEDIHIFGTERQNNWELWVKKAQGGKIFKDLSLDKIKGVFYLADKMELLMSGQKGLMKSDKKDLVISGRVVLKVNGYIIELKDMEYNHKQKKIVSQSGIRVLTMDKKKQKGDSNLIIQAFKMEFDLSSSKVKMFDNVIVRASLSKEDIYLESDSLEVDIKNNWVELSGGVVMDGKELRVTSNQAKFYYDPETKSLSKASLLGGVKLEGEDKKAQSERLDIYWPKKKYVLSGNPRLFQGGSEFRGKEIILLNGGETLQVMKVRARLKKTIKNKKGSVKDE